MAVCNNCGATISDKAKFCTECGAKVEITELKPVCGNCGATLREGAKFCVECGTPIQVQQENEQKTEVVPDNSVNEVEDEHLKTFMTNLGEALSQAIELQRNDSNKRLWMLGDYAALFGDNEEAMDDFFGTEEYEQIGGATASISNCCFLPDNGREVFPNTLNDGKPHLMLDFCLYENEEQTIIDKLIASSIYKKFTHIKVEGKYSLGTHHHFYMDCGENVDEMVNVFKVIVKDVYAIQLTLDWQFEVFLQGTKQETQKEAVDMAKSQVKNLKLQATRIQ